MSFRQIFNEEKVSEKGFTLVEVLVAIFIGLIVMAMAVAILGVTNSVSIRVLAKSEAQQTTRNSIVKLLDSLANAESLETCRVADNADDQSKINDPTRGMGRSDVSLANCREYTKTGEIIAWANSNKICYYDKSIDDTARNDFPSLRCITRGGAAARDTSSPFQTANSNTGINIANCVSAEPGDNIDLVYVYSCTPSGSSDRNNWPTVFNGITPGSTSVIADLGSNLNRPITDPRKDLFGYVVDGGIQDGQNAESEPNRVFDNARLVDIVAVRVYMEVRFATQRANNQDSYRFNQTIVLRESKKATEEEFNG